MVEIPSFLKFRLISNTRGKPPTINRFRYNSGAMRKIEIDAERIMMRHERLGRRAARYGMHHRRLDFEKPTLDEKGTNPGNDPAARGKIRWTSGLAIRSTYR